MHNIDQDVQLLREYLKGNIHYDSHTELRRLLNEHPSMLAFLEQLKNEENLGTILEQYRTLADFDREELDLKKDPMLQKILAVTKEKRAIRIIPIYWQKTAIAIVALLIAVFGIYSIIYKSNHSEQITRPSEISFEPGTNKAYLSTSDGKKIELNTSYEEIVIGEHIQYKNGTTLFEGAPIDQDISLTLHTPRGGQYQVTLSDGTKVWLNADSKITYPRQFAHNERLIQLHGEAYFEVAKEKNRPFIVMTDREKVEVLGTHFNVNSYTEEVHSMVSLIEGKVKVSLANQQFEILNPGEQTKISRSTIQKEKIDISESLAWKNGEFMFNKEPLSSVMRKLARWYDIDITVDPALKDLLIWGSVSRYNNFNEVLEIIKMTDDKIQINTEGRRVTLMK